MLFYVVIWLLKPIIIHSAATRRPHNTLRRNSLQYHLNDFVNDDDSVLTQEKAVNFNIQAKFNSLLDNTNIKSSKPKSIPDTVINLRTKSGKSNQHNRTKHSPQKTDVTNIGSDYNYDYLLNEYHEEALSETNSNITYHFDKDPSQCSFLNIIQTLFGLHNKNSSEWDDGFNTFKCISYDYKSGEETIDPCVGRLWKILQIWFLAYLVLAIPLWCTRGVCCCFLFCKFFKPQKTIEEAKKYFIMNPPGLLKATIGHEVLYEPTKSERDCYEEFEHLIRTI